MFVTIGAVSNGSAVVLSLTYDCAVTDTEVYSRAVNKILPPLERLTVAVGKDGRDAACPVGGWSTGTNFT